MIKIKGKHTKFDFNSLCKCSDLIYCEGSLLSHYMSEMGDHYLAYWVDADEYHNRWIIIRTSLGALRQYVNREIPLWQVITNPADRIVWMTDIDDTLTLGNTQILSPEEIPNDYLPEPTAMYDFETEDPLLMGDTESYELQVPKRDHSLFTQFIHRMGWTASNLRKVAVL